jgi:hypothetical protein
VLNNFDPSKARSYAYYYYYGYYPYRYGYGYGYGYRGGDAYRSPVERNGEGAPPGGPRVATPLPGQGQAEGPPPSES